MIEKLNKLCIPKSLSVFSALKRMDEQKRKDEKDNEAERRKMEPVYLSLLIALPIIFFILAKLFGAE